MSTEKAPAIVLAAEKGSDPFFRLVAAAPGFAPPSALQRIGRHLLLKQLAGLVDGEIRLHEGASELRFGTASARCPLSVTVRVHHPQFYADVAFGGTVGAGEAYMDAHWECDDLTSLVRIMVVNRDLMSGMEGGWAAVASAPLRKLFHWANRNSRTGSARNIAAHYDLGNDLFELMLDDTMAYSCGIFTRPDATLREASLAKFDAVCRKLDLQPGDRVLEIGTGWGGLAIHAAQHYGCHVTTTTISREQHDYARERIARAGLEDRITLLLEDYRELRPGELRPGESRPGESRPGELRPGSPGPGGGRSGGAGFDKLISIEMIEAVGHQYLDTFFATCNRLLAPHGAMLLQAITIRDQLYEAALDSVDFIQRFIFPGSFIPSVRALGDSVARVTDMKVFHLEDIGPHYATTLRRWRENFLANLPALRALGYPERFVRMWQYYLCYCEGGFEERQLGDVQMLLTKPGCRRPPL